MNGWRRGELSSFLGPWIIIRKVGILIKNLGYTWKSESLVCIVIRFELLWFCQKQVFKFTLEVMEWMGWNGNP